MRPSLLSLALILLVELACTERISAPEAARILEELEAPNAARDVKRFGTLLERTEWLGWGRDPKGISVATITVQRDGLPRVYRAHVIERLMPPLQLDSTDRCAHATLERRMALLWTDAPGGGGIWLNGGDYQRPLGRGAGNCSTLRLIGPEPTLFDIPELHDPDQNSWVSESGQADISPGIVVGACAFLDSTVERELRVDVGISCVRTQHTISFTAIVRRAGRTVRLELAPVQVEGMRYTVHCDGTGRFGPQYMCTRYPPP